MKVRHTLAGCALALAAVGCDFQASSRSSFSLPTRDAAAFPDAPAADAAPRSDGGAPDAPPAVRRTALRITRLDVQSPEGLAVFQSQVSSALARENLNLLLVVEGERLEGELPLTIGSARAIAPGQFRWIPEYPPATSTIRFGADGSVTVAAGLELVVLGKVGFDFIMPVRRVGLSATRTPDGRLGNGRLFGVVLGEDAAATLLDTQNDGDPSNDAPLSSYLDPGNLDLDGDGVLDDYSVDTGIDAVELPGGAI